MIQLSQLNVYPIKSCAGTSLHSAEMTATGLKNDRALMITTPKGQFMTQRYYPRMALIKPWIDENNVLSLSAPGMSDIQAVIQTDGDVSSAVVWRSTCEVVVQALAINQWISEFLETDLQLVAMHQQFSRGINPDNARSDKDIVSFADGYATLIISQASLDNLNAKLKSPVPMNRFRPNLVVTGCDPHAEDLWQAFRIGRVEFESVNPCPRCAVPNIDQATAAKTVEPNRTLAGYRRVGSQVMFGMNLVHNGEGQIKVGDTVDILQP